MEKIACHKIRLLYCPPVATRKPGGIKTMKIIDYVSDDVPAWAISYLVNGDASGLDDGEADMVDDWRSGITERLLTQYPGACIQFLMDDDAEPSFCRYPSFGLAADCIPAALAVWVDNDHPAARIALPWEDEDENEDEDEDEENPIAAAFNRIMQSAVFRTGGPAIDLPEALTDLGNAVRNNETDETTGSLGEYDVCTLSGLIAGSYWALTEWHGGQSSPEYAAMCALGRVFSPGMCASGPEPDSDESDAYDAVCAWFESRTR